jgi:hypothetical protein
MRSQTCIVTGPRIDLAIALIDRMKKLFAAAGNSGGNGIRSTVSEYRSSTRKHADLLLAVYQDADLHFF